MRYELWNGLETEFSRSLLDHLNSKALIHVVAEVNGFIDDLGVSFIQHPSFYYKAHKIGGKIGGKDFFSELLLLGFNCPGIRGDQCAVVGDIGYWWNGDLVELIERNFNVLSEYEIEEFLFKPDPPIKKLYKVKVVGLL
jgi:hypothetical protein